MSTPTDDVRRPAADELRVLRERAYGPAADIHDDPEALARLRELEAAAAMAEVPDASAEASVTAADTERDETDGPGEPGAPRDAIAAGPFATADADDASDADAADVPVPDARPVPRLTRRTVWLWAGSVVAALLAGAAITMATPSFMGERVAVLAEADISEWPTGMFGDAQEGARVFEAYSGVRALIVPNPWGSPDAATPCVFVVRAEGEAGSDVSNEILTTGCGDARFPPTASFAVTERSPEALRDRFPVGTGVRIVVEGDEAHVFARTP